MESVIKWQTGEPKESGVYLVSISTENEIGVTVLNWDNKEGKFLFVDFFSYITILAWCKLSDIEPYKEKIIWRITTRLP